MNSLNFQIEFFQNKIRNKNDDSKNKSNYLSHLDHNKKDLSFGNKSQNDFSKIKNINLKDLSFCANDDNMSHDTNVKRDDKCVTFTNQEHYKKINFEENKEIYFK